MDLAGLRFLLIILASVNIANLYAGPRIQGPNIRFLDYPSEVIENSDDGRWAPDSLRYNSTTIRYRNIKNDLFILNRNTGGFNNNQISLNISMNKNSEILLLPLFDLSNFDLIHFEPLVTYTTDQIEISPVYINYYNYELLNIKLIFNFNNDLLLTSSKIIRINENEIFEECYYVYDDNKRLINIIAKTNDNIEITRKSLFYDGIYRNIPRPYFYDLVRPNTDEIIIFEGTAIKFHFQIRRSFGDGRTNEPPTLIRKEETWYYVLFEYNQYGDEIRQSIHYNDGEIISYFTNYFEYDDRNNWLRKVYADDLNNNIIGVNRGIRY